MGSLKPVETVREYSFLQNERIPAGVRESQKSLAIGSGRSAIGQLRALSSTKVRPRSRSA
mgnify:CR=1 FL=1